MRWTQGSFFRWYNSNSARDPQSIVNNNDFSIEDPTEIAEEFNNYFINIGPSLAAKIPQTELYSHGKGFLSSHPIFTLSPVNEKEICDIVSSLKSTSAGVDDLKIKLVKQCLPTIVKPLCHIYCA